MKEKLKIYAVLIGVVGLIVAVILIIRFIKRKPKIDISSVDWLGKTAIYNMSAGGSMKGGTASLGESGSGGGGGYQLTVESKGNTMNFRIEKSGQVIKSKTIDFSKKSIIDNV
jgi:hypothetical protein